MEKDLNYYRVNAEEDYAQTPISVLRYITELEIHLRALRLSARADSNDNSPIDCSSGTVKPISDTNSAQ